MIQFLLDNLVQILLVGLLGGVFSLDGLAWGQFMFSRPIVVAPFFGWLLGDVTLGFAVGALLELISAHYLPIGSTVSPDFTLAAILTPSACLLVFKGQNPASVVPIALFLSLILAVISMKTEIYVRQINIGLVHRADVLVRKNLFAPAWRLNLLGLGFFALRGFLLTTFFLVLCLLLLRGLSRYLPSMLLQGTALLKPLLMALGAAVVTELSAERRALWIFSLTFIVILLTLWRNWFSLPWLLGIFFVLATLYLFLPGGIKFVGRMAK